MSLHDVVAELVQYGVPNSPEKQERMLAAIAEDRAAQVHRDGPKLVPDPVETDAAPPEVAPRYDPDTGERLQ